MFAQKATTSDYSKNKNKKPNTTIQQIHAASPASGPHIPRTHTNTD